VLQGINRGIKGVVCHKKKMKSSFIKICFMILILSSCGKRKEEAVLNKEVKFHKLNYDEQINQIKENTSKDSVLSFDQEFINKEILKGKYKVELEKYLKEDCYPFRLNRVIQIQEFEGFQNIGDIDNDMKDDFVFVLNPLSYCEEGQSYYFSNPTIERIYTESNCCHPNSIFSIGDIDEDGRNEIGQYYSSCASRFKKINIWTNNGNNWELVDEIAFTINDEFEVFKDFNKLYKKKSKGILEFLEISDINANGELIKDWKTIEMK
jgi:hypothetical protein